MTGKKVESMLAWFRRHYDEFKDTYAYYNIKKVLTDNDVDRIRNFCIKRPEVDFFIIISEINSLRPQRTFGDLPEWFRNDTAWHDIYKDENSFVFISCETSEYQNLKEKKRVLFENTEDLARSINSDCVIWKK